MMKKVYSVALDPELVAKVKKTPYINFSALVNHLLEKHVEETKK